MVRAAGDHLTVEPDPERAVAGSDAVMADTWVSMHDGVDSRDRRHNQLKPYQVTAR